MSNKNKNINITIKMDFSADMSKDQVRDTISEAIKVVCEKSVNDHKNTNIVDSNKKSFLQWLKTVFSLPFIPKEKVSGNEATMTLLSTGVSLIFWLVYFALFIISLLSVFGYPIVYVWILKNPSTPTNIASFIAMGVVLYLVSGVFRMASIEVGKMKNNDNIINLFAAVMAMIAVVVALLVR